MAPDPFQGLGGYGGGAVQKIIERFKWRMAKWFWAPPVGMPLAEREYEEWIKPQEGDPLERSVRRGPRAGKGGPKKALKNIPEFYHRGSYERREPRLRHRRKAVLRFRGKGMKVERRRGKRA